MGTEDIAFLDWTNLPPDSNVQSLWVCLHDAEIKSIKSDLLRQYVVLEIEAFYLPDDLRVFLQFDEVASARVNKYQRPYESLLTPGMSAREINDIATPWVGKWREESMGWLEFEAAYETDTFTILEADLATGEKDITLKLDGFLNGDKYDDLWCSVFIRAKSISLSRSDGEDLSWAQFIELGGQWWESFGSNENKSESSG